MTNGAQELSKELLLFGFLLLFGEDLPETLLMLVVMVLVRLEAIEANLLVLLVGGGGGG